MTEYDKAVAWLQNNFCSKYNDFKTECANCPNAKCCYMDLSDVSDVSERTAIFENRIIDAVIYFQDGKGCNNL